MMTMIQMLRDFKPILDHGEYMPEEIITGSKIDLDLSAGSIYTRVYTVDYLLINGCDRRL